MYCFFGTKKSLLLLLCTRDFRNSKPKMKPKLRILANSKPAGCVNAERGREITIRGKGLQTQTLSSLWQLDEVKMSSMWWSDRIPGLKPSCPEWPLNPVNLATHITWTLPVPVENTLSQLDLQENEQVQCCLRWFWGRSTKGKEICSFSAQARSSLLH